MDDLLSEFLTETTENLEIVDIELVRFEADPSDQATLNNIFRLVHTVKGTCGFLGLPRLEGVAHAGETLLGKFRDHAIEVTPDLVTLTLRCVDRIKEIVAGLGETGVEPDGDDSALLADLHAAAEGKAAAPVAPPQPLRPARVGPNGERWDEDLQRFLRPGEVSLADLETAFRTTQRGADEAPAPRLPAGREAVKQAATAPAPFAAKARPEPDDEEAHGPRDPASQTIRVSVDVLENLMTMVSELVLTRNSLLQMVRTLNDSEFKTPLQRLSNITAELQDRVMKTRMQPVGGAWRKLPRIIRDICRDVGKKIELKLEGEAVELDRQVLELIKDPLTHMVRNSADHGIESPATRIMAGKPETGTIHLSARHEGGHIIIEIADDGAGLNTTRIRDKAVEKGLLTAAEAAALSDAQIHRFIFAPGFSTAAAVTNLSGRGVGMDVVKTNIEVIGGAIELHSVEGQGTTFRIQIPLTLAIVSALILGARGQRFAAPQTSVVELVRVGEGAEHKIDEINRLKVLRLRERLLPLIDLGEVLKLAPGLEGERAVHTVVVMQVGAARFGLVVDDVHDTEEIVVKPLASLLRGTPALSGATILGDGAVVVILDPNGLAATLGAARVEAAKAAHAPALLAQTGAEEKSLVLFLAGDGEKAAPMELVTRLEDVPCEKIERADGRAVLQYRGALMTILHPNGLHALAREGSQPLLVFAQDDFAFGLAVDRIVDVVRERVTFDLTADRPGLLGVSVIRGKATEVIDVSYYLAQAQAEWGDRRARRAVKGRLLLVDQSAFARNMLSPLLTAAGYQIEAVASVEDAWALNKRGDAFDAIMTDLDSDRQSAADFARRLSQDPLWGEAARVAFSGEAREAENFAEVVRKSDRAGLLAALDYALKTRRNAA